MRGGPLAVGHCSAASVNHWHRRFKQPLLSKAHPGPHESGAGGAGVACALPLCTALRDAPRARCIGLPRGACWRHIPHCAKCAGVRSGPITPVAPSTSGFMLAFPNP